MLESGSPSSKETAEFYDKLMSGEEQRSFLGVDRRFNSNYVRGKESVQKFFVSPLRKLIKPTDRVLDFGCGPGTFSSLVAPMCKQIEGVDISDQFISSASELCQSLGLKNIRFQKVDSIALPFEDDAFDVILLVDVVHHLEIPSANLPELRRVLKQNGRIIIFEPNKLNPLIWWIHYKDPNEKGLLALGTPAKYRSLLANFFKVERVDFNGIVIGPSSKAFDLVSKVLNSSFVYPFLGWLNPKLVVIGSKQDA